MNIVVLYLALSFGNQPPYMEKLLEYNTMEECTGSFYGIMPYVEWWLSDKKLKNVTKFSIVCNRETD